MLLGRVHLAEGLLVAGGDEHRVVAEAPLAARRPDQNAVDPALEPFAMAVRPAQGQRTDEMGVAARNGVERAQLVLDAPHRQPEIAFAADLAWARLGRHARIGQRPARREDAGPVAERLDA